MTAKFWRIKFPFEYEMSPKEIRTGTNWVTLKLKNVGMSALNELDVQLHSMDTYNLTVFGTGLFGAGEYLPYLGLNMEKELVFRVNAIGSAEIYATVTGRKDGDYICLVTYFSPSIV